ncbi:MAG: hypothetical protein DME12_05470 [Candidatus Rokuibacteriota bacterium]|nr:MAG: hypothetical protein DME12_05470 [Candidatus Rokubacteria bacterium]
MAGEVGEMPIRVDLADGPPGDLGLDGQPPRGDVDCGEGVEGQANGSLETRVDQSCRRTERAIVKDGVAQDRALRVGPTLEPRGRGDQRVVDAQEAFEPSDACGDGRETAVGSESEDHAALIGVETIGRDEAMGADVQAPVGGDGQPARALDAGRQDSQRPGVFETQDAPRVLLRDEEPAPAVEGETGGAIEPGGRSAQRAARGESIDDAGPTVGDVARALRGHGDTDQLVAPLEDGLDRRERGDRLVRRDRSEGEHQEDGRGRRPA